MQRGRRIAFDYGDVRIGVAVCDPDGILATPLKTLESASKRLAAQVQEILEEFEPITIYVGRPSNMDGSAGASAKKAQAFCEFLSTMTQTPIELIDERLSTVSAARNMREAGKSTKTSKRQIDQAAAVAILEFALSIEKNRK